MKIPYLMLRDFVDTQLNPADLCDLLTMAGFEVEGTEEVEGDTVLEIKVCSNRGDGLSALGLSREILAKEPLSRPTALYQRAAAGFVRDDSAAPSALRVPLKVESKSCDRFAYRGFSGIKNGDSPTWIAKRLHQAGMRPISLLVDLTNYVMLEVGQPLHAYDLRKLNGPEIGVRDAREGELLKTLDGVERRLSSQNMVIIDGKGPIGVAGVMGGENTEVDDSTSEVLLEAAHFNHRSVRSTRKQLGLNTEASYRFERSVDPALVFAALNRVADLLEEAGQGNAILPGVTTAGNSEPDQLKRCIPLRMDRARKLLGFTFSDEEAAHALLQLGFQLSANGDKFDVAVPTWRFDVEREEDLVEDIGRVLGYDRIPESMPVGATTVGGIFGAYKWHDDVIAAALQGGMDQAMTHSLVGESPLFSPKHGAVSVQNPASPETAFVRNSLLPGLAQAVLRNAPSGRPFFEIGPVFRHANQGYETLKSFAILGFGPIGLPNRKQDSPPSLDFFWAKAQLEQIFGELTFSASEDSRFHAGRRASISGRVTGVVGQIHPKIADQLGLPQSTVAAEVDLVEQGAIAAGVNYHPISKTPSIRRDIAFAISKSVPYEQVDRAVREAAGELLESIWLFDVYEGPGIEPGHHSLAIALTLRKHGATFTDEEANQVRDGVVAAIGKLGAKQR